MSTFLRTATPHDQSAARRYRRFPARWVGTILLAAASLTASGLQAQTPPAPATVAGVAVATAAPQPRPLLILRFNGKTIALKTRSARQSPGSLLVETLDGAAQTLDPGTFINQLAWYTDAEMESGRVDLNALAIRYRAFAGLYPEVRATLNAEAQRFLDIAARTKAASAQHEAETQKRVGDLLALHFDPTTDHNRDEVAAIVREGDELIRLAPVQSAQITQATSAARDTLAKLDAGQIFYDGRWMPGAEATALRKNREEAAIQKTFGATLALPVAPLVLGAGQLIPLLGLPLLILLTLGLSGLVLLASKRRVAGILTIASTFVLAAAGCYLATENNSGGLAVPRADAPETLARSERVVALLYRAAKPEAALQPEDQDVRLTNLDLSSFLASQVHSAGKGEAGFGLRREEMAVGVTPDGFVLLEQATLAGLTVPLRCDVKIDGTGESPSIKSYTVHAGALLVPNPVKSWLWASLSQPLGEYVAKHRLLEAYALTDMARGEIRLASNRTLGTSATGPLPYGTTGPASTLLPHTETGTAPMPEGTPASSTPETENGGQ